jgi:outer membrane receptor protein involved in Fe transport
MNYKHSFPREGRELTADVIYNSGDRSDGSTILNTFFFPDGSQYEPPAQVLNDGSSNEEQLTFQSDFVNPLKENIKIETGIRSYHNKNRSFYNVFANDNGQQVKLPLSNNYEYREMVNALYLTFSVEKEKYSYQLGLRAEHSKFTGLLVDSAYKFGYEYPNKIDRIWDALFPSVFYTKKLGEEDEIQVNYTRRIRRPRFMQLNPFIEINDPVNLQQGNPQLRPEFMNSFELNYSNAYKNGSFLGVLYFRNNPDDITQYSDTITAAQYQQLDNAAVDPNAILNTFINASTTNHYGAEFTLQHKLARNFDITPTVELEYRTVNANVKGLDLSNKGFNWEAKLIANYKIETNRASFFNNFSFQLMGEYESAEVIPQGKQIPQYTADFAIRKDFLKNNKATFTFAVNDIFNTRRWGTIYDTDQFYQDSYRRQNVRNFRLSFSYKFGDADFSLSRRDRGNDDDDE